MPTDEMLKAHVQSIVDILENPPEVDEEGTLASELGWTYDDEEDVWRDEDGEEMETRPMSGFDYLQDILDIEYRVGADGEYRGAEVLVAFGGPNIWIDTKRSRVEGAWWSDTYSESFNDNIGLDEACEELWGCR